MEKLPEKSRGERAGASWSAMLAVAGVLVLLLSVIFVAGGSRASAGSASGTPGAGKLTLASLAHSGADLMEESPDHQRVSICHRTHSERHPYVEIRIPEFLVERHMRHGDIYPVPPGGCPRYMGTPVPTGVPTGVPTALTTPPALPSKK